jgi:hypothetical protein
MLKAARTSSVKSLSVKTEWYSDLANFSFEYMALAECLLLKYGSRNWSSWPPLAYKLFTVQNVWSTQSNTSSTDTPQTIKSKDDSGNYRPMHVLLIKVVIIYTRGGQLDQLREPQFRKQQSATAMYSTLKLIKSNYRSVMMTNILLSLYEQL